jgi:hypothetical protein
VYAFVISPHACYIPAHLILLHLIVIIMFSEEYKLRSRCSAISFSFQSLHSTSVQIFSSVWRCIRVGLHPDLHNSSSDPVVVSSAYQNTDEIHMCVYVCNVCAYVRNRMQF